MRAAILFALLLVAGCGRGFLAPDDVAGHWTTPFKIPGSGFGLTLSQVGDSVFGPGTYQVEAGPAGTLTVTGRYDRPTVRLVMVYDNGRRLDFVGRLVEWQMIGTATDSQGGSFSMVFQKR